MKRIKDEPRGRNARESKVFNLNGCKCPDHGDKLEANEKRLADIYADIDWKVYEY